MDWIELTIRTVSEGIELLCAALTDAGFDSFAIDDQAEFRDFLATSGDYWDYVDERLQARMEGLSQVRLYLLEQDAPTQLSALRSLLSELPSRYPACHFGALTISLETVPNEDWETSWMRFYRPLPIGKRLMVVPQWMTYDGERIPIILDLGLTFGTGEHASTRMCMTALEELVHGGERVADLGSGSGILSITALRLGAECAIGVDVDPAAEHIARQNAAANGYGASRFTACTGNVLSDDLLLDKLTADGGYDLVCANIVAGVIVRLAPLVPRLLNPGGRFLCSGILNNREQEIRDALEAAGLHLVSSHHSEEWCCFVAQ